MLRRRNGAPEKADEGEVARAATDDTDQIVLRQDTMTRLLRCIDELDAPCRAALKLRMAGVPAEEAAQMLGISREAFYKRAQRGYAVLRERMVREDAL